MDYHKVSAGKQQKSTKRSKTTNIHKKDYTCHRAESRRIQNKKQAAKRMSYKLILTFFAHLIPNNEIEENFVPVALPLGQQHANL